MQTLSCPAVLVSAPASGQGKTLTSAALARAWRNQGLKVQVFKCGPDFIDSMILQVASGNPVYNLDLGMCGLEDGRARLYQAAQEADVIMAEGVMGLYDGTPSSADIAETFGLPVMLTIDASGMAQTFGAVALGLYQYRPALKRAGVIANQVGSAGHAQMLKDCLPGETPWFGHLQKDELFRLPERHLGLHLADEIDDLDARIEAAARALSNGQALALPPTVNFAPAASPNLTPLLAGKTIAIAKDTAFCFIYPANLDCLRALGAELRFFSPLHDTTLPEADAYWLPGGYPELHLPTLSNNHGMQAGLQQAKAAGKPILAECGGMMALGNSLNGTATFGLLTGDSEIQPTLQGLGSQHVSTSHGKLAAHTFHYGQFRTPLTASIRGESQWGQGEALYREHNITASFLHFYFPSNPQATAELFLP